MQSEELSWLREAINELHSGESRYIGTVSVKESFAGQIDWEGQVSGFELIGHPKAKRPYAWSYRDGDKIKTVTALGLPPAISARGAVAGCDCFQGQKSGLNRSSLKLGQCRWRRTFDNRLALPVCFLR
jgi:hypothetical protein